MTRIAVCAPATAITREHAAVAERLVAEEFPEHSIHFHEQCFLETGHFAGTDTERLEALVEFANSPDYDAVWFAKGGYGSNRIAEAAIAKMDQAARSKTYIGYSDMGYLLAGLYQNGIGQAVHGPLAMSAGSPAGQPAARRVLRWLSGDLNGLEPSLDGHTPTVAFNLMTLAMICGTPLMPRLDGHIVMVEEVSEHLYSIDRLFFHISQHLTGAAGLRLGQITDIPDNDREFGQSVEDIVKFWCERAGIPYLGRAEIGHTVQNRIVPFGLAGSPTGD
ncbi:Muramoyltetrapeptide carboxypeptidase [Altererythrobacter insulae]|nr:Muramoyltetrapeptide carboxypeptidase [Altererythrobacter insulae]